VLELDFRAVKVAAELRWHFSWTASSFWELSSFCGNNGYIKHVLEKNKKDIINIQKLLTRRMYFHRNILTVSTI
jgi:hypothetical protein